MRRFALLAGLLAFAVSAPVLAAGNPDAGKTKAASCTSCHGMNGVSNNDLWPNLAGQKAGYLEKQLKAFRSGARQDPMMAPMVKNLSDEDIADLAAYFSGMKP